MPIEQDVCELRDFIARVAPEEAVVLRSPSVVAQVSRALPYPVIDTLPADGLTHPWLLVVGGGTLIDAAKLWRRDTSSPVRIAAAASLWGSGAEASTVAVGPGDPKRIALGDDLRPDLRVRWPELGLSVPAAQARWACGDVWSHALEAFLSPLAGEALQAELAALLQALMQQALVYSPDWFDLSARACALQAQASVGLVHGMAHVLEPGLRAAGRPDLAHHARLCATLMYPVLRFNLAQSHKAADRLARHGVDAGALLSAVHALFSPADFDALVPLINERWPQILRDACSRTNVVLVRRDALATLLAGATP